MKTLLSALAAAVLMSTAAMAADSADTKKPVDKPVVTTTSKPKPSAQSEKSKKCSAEADTKKLHGKARKAFRKECLKAA